MFDIGNLHVIDYYLYHATTYDYNKPPWAKPTPYTCTCPKCVDTADFDISTEQREGWAYGDD